MRIFQKFLISFIFILPSMNAGFCQSVPASEENIPYLITFGPQADKAWGDDDFTQTFFFIVPESWKKPFFLRVYDPDTGGKLDELKGAADTRVSFSVYGGSGAFSEKDAQFQQPTGNYKSGTLLTSRTFDGNEKFDQKWFTFGPLNPAEGEYISGFRGYVFKVIAQGISGNDGNLYSYFLSSLSTENKVVEGSNAFTYEYSFRMWDQPLSVSHIYPFVSDSVTSIKIHTFDFDNDGLIRIVSLAKKSEMVAISNDNEWIPSVHDILPKEKNSSLDIQIVKTKKTVNNNVVFYITNQYGKSVAFFTSPIGGIPKYRYDIKVDPVTGPRAK